MRRIEQGFCLWFTGLSGAGKSTVAQAVESRLNESGRTTTLLDGDVIRTHLSKGLGFSKEDRDENIKRIGYVASQVVRHNGVVICAVISPYRETRDNVRRYFENDNFIEIYISTPIEVCEKRDPKGLYMLARKGKVTGFTGIDDIYEPPINPEVVIDTSKMNIESAVQIVLGVLHSRGYY